MNSKDNQPQGIIVHSERLLWTRPVVKRLSVSLDTANATGSFTDLTDHTLSSPVPSP